MISKLLTAIISILCVLMMMAMTFQPAAASRRSDGMIMQKDIFIDKNGNTHMVYSQFVQGYSYAGPQFNPIWQTDIFYKNNIGINGNGNSWNTPVQISDSESNSQWAQVSIDETTGIVYVLWIEETQSDNKFWYAGSSDVGLSFTSQRYGAAVPWPVAPNLDMDANNGILLLTWKPYNSLALAADIDCDLIPDISDAEPIIYNTDNFAIEIAPDVIATDNELGVTVAIDYEGDDFTIPTVSSTTGDFAISTGDYIQINLETGAEFSAIIKMPYSDVPPTLSEDYLRMYRQVGEDWVVITDWELGEFTGISTEHSYVWAYVKHFSTFTIADASQWDGDSDGLTDLTEDTEPSTTTNILLNESDFTKTTLSTNPSDITSLSFEVESYNSYLAIRGFLEIISTSSQPIKNLELDIGNNGNIDWRAPVDFDGTLRLGGIKNAISDYMFWNNLNTEATTVEIPFRFISSTPGEFFISQAQIEINDVTTWNNKADTSGDGLYDGWVNRNGDFAFQKEGEDEILGTADDEIPGTLAYSMNPTVINVVGSSGTVPWNEFQDEINQVNGNLVINSVDLEFATLGNTMMLERTYNSLNSEVIGPFGYGWSFNYGEKLEIRRTWYPGGDITIVYYHAGDGSIHEFECLGSDDNDNTYFSSPPGISAILFTKTVPNSGFYLKYSNGLTKTFLTNGQLYTIQQKATRACLYMIYDAGGKLTQVQDHTTHFYLNFAYDANGMISEISDPAGRTNTYTYLDGKIITRTDAMANGYLYEYDPILGKISTMINPLGMYKEYEFSPNFPHQVTRCTVGEYDFTTGMKLPEPRINTYQALYNYPLSTHASDANNWETERYFGMYGTVTETRYPDTSVVSRNYDAKLNIVTVNDGLGCNWLYSFDPISNLQIETDPKGGVSQVEYINTVGPQEYLTLPIKITDRNGYYYEIEYEQLHKTPSEIRDMDGVSTYLWYNYADLLTAKLLPNNAVTVYTYDLYGNLINKNGPLDTSTRYEYDRINRNIRTTEAYVSTTQYYYDALDRIIQIIDPEYNEETFSYDVLGNILTYTNKVGATTTYTYDVFSRKISETDALGHTIYFEYDNKGNIIREIDKRGVSIYNQYDSMDRLVRVTDALGGYERYAYDANGNQLEKYDKLGNKWYKYYDELGRVTHDFCPYNLPISYEYDGEGHIVKRTDRMGYETCYEYDHRGNLVRELGAEGSDTWYEYDDVDNCVSVTQIDGKLTDGTLLENKNYPLLNWQYYGNNVQPSVATYYITNVWELQNMNNDLSGSYVLANDIDASVTSTWNDGAGFEPIGSEMNRFIGSFDGQGHNITGLYINRPFWTWVGLFGFVGTGGVLKNVGLISVDITGSNQVAGLAGVNWGAATNTFVTGIVSGNQFVGHLVGENGGTVSKSYSKGSVSAGGEWAGGLIGSNWGTVTKSYSTCSVSGAYYLGGLVGSCSGSGTVTDSYSTGTINGNQYIGGLVGKNTGTVSTSYATGTVSGNDFVGGLVGENSGAVTSSFYDMETTGQSDTGKGVPKTTAEMKDQTTFTNSNWDFTTIWWVSPPWKQYSYGYDLLGRKISETTPMGFTYYWSYDTRGNSIEYIDANGQKTSYQYDRLNRLTGLTLPGANLQDNYQVNITYLITEKEREEYDYPPIMVIYGLPTSMLPMPPRMAVMEKEFDVLGRTIREMWAITDIDSFQVGETNFYNITYE